MSKDFLTTRIYKNNKYIGQYPPQPFSLEKERDPNQKNKGYRRRWHPYKKWCMGHCNYCDEMRGYKRWKKAKHTRKRKILKFQYFFDYP